MQSRAKGIADHILPLGDLLILPLPTDGPTDKRTDKASHRVARPKLKREGWGFSIQFCTTFELFSGRIELPLGSLMSGDV